jgi:hypothetical protein
MIDKGGAHSGADRRKFQFNADTQEKRLGRDRKKGLDRRNPVVRRRGADFMFLSMYLYQAYLAYGLSTGRF